jgi:hypothetical protein
MTGERRLAIKFERRTRLAVAFKLAGAGLSVIAALLLMWAYSAEGL